MMVSLMDREMNVAMLNIDKTEAARAGSAWKSRRSSSADQSVSMPSSRKAPIAMMPLASRSLEQKCRPSTDSWCDSRVDAGGGVDTRSWRGALVRRITEATIEATSNATLIAAKCVPLAA